MEAKFKTQIYDVAKSFNLDPTLVAAIVAVESGSHPDKVRYEPGYRWIFKPEDFAKALNITLDTEKVLQSCSWGLMQIMGATARQHGFKEDMPVLCHPEKNLFYGCKHLKSLVNKYPIQTDAIAAYNAGTPKEMANGKYFNQQYIDKVTKQMMIIGGRK